MRRLLVFAFFLFSANWCGAMCWFGTSVWPQTPQVAPNAVFVLSDSGLDNLVPELNKKYPVFLVSGKDTIAVEAQEVGEGQYQQRQALLVPSEKLKAGKTYALFIRNLDSSHFKSPRWTVSEQEDREIPRWIKTPVFSANAYIEYGCGPARWVHCCACVSDSSPVLIAARIKNLSTGAVTDCFIEPGLSGFSIGHGMCSGELDFDKGGKFEASFRLMDASGNAFDEFIPALRFSAPGPGDQVEEEFEGINPCNCKAEVKKASVSASGDEAVQFVFWLLLIFVALLIGAVLLPASKKE